MQNDYSLASIIYRVSLKTPDKTALIIPKVFKQKIKYFEKVSYSDFWNRVSEISYGLKQCFKPGDKVSVLIDISVDLYALVIAMLACEITPVFLDPGMGRKNLKSAINSIELNKFVGTKSLLKYRWFLPRFWRKKFYSLNSSGILVKRLNLQPELLLPSQINSKEQTALISFTSGTTGVPKGANRTFYSLFHQHIALRKSFPDTTNDIDMTCFPIAVLHGLCCGITNFLPPINFKKIDNFQSDLIIRELEAQSITRLTAAPKFLNILTDYMINKEIVNINIRALAAGGAIVKESLVKKLQVCFPNSDSWIVYGSTEAEPMAKINFKTFVNNNQNASGHLVGKSVDVAAIKIIDTNKLNINLLPEEISSLEVENGQ
ncbi:MAG: AMP-binding protein, partial [Bdellovibrionales bacterium]|nr:AMP-binding protein [Bdellovibrionales bacterium]